MKKDTKNLLIIIVIGIAAAIIFGVAIFLKIKMNI